MPRMLTYNGRIAHQFMERDKYSANSILEEFMNLQILKGGENLRLIIELSTKSSNEFVLPIQYNYFIQSMIYRSLDSDFANFLHEQGFESGDRRFKLFVFSRLLGKFRMDRGKNKIIFQSPIKLIVVSPIHQFCQSLSNGLLTKKDLHLGPNAAVVKEINVQNHTIDDETVKMRTLSPVVAYSILLRPEGGKYTCYFQPGENEFARLVNLNLKNKYKALHAEKAPEGEVEIRTLGNPKLHVMQYKGIVIKGYSASLVLSGPKILLQLALDAGLGSKNSMGFGCLEKTNPKG